MKDNIIKVLTTATNSRLITKYNSNINKFQAWLEYIEVKEGGVLSSVWGKGDTVEEAIINYIDLIKDKHLVKITSGEDRKEFIIISI